MILNELKRIKAEYLNAIKEAQQALTPYDPSINNVMASSQGAGYRVEVIRCITRYVSLRAIRATVEARAVTESIRRAELASLPDKAMLLLVPGQISRCCQSVKVSSQKCQSQKP